ncbi:MAG: S-adenosylmethionine decarboxylase [Pseudomonadales bacterium]|nr:S-adenosylmethionine decarboxylase [Pseudomonadales bacterium]
MTNITTATHLTSVTRSLAINVYQFWHAKSELSLQQWFEKLEAEHSSINLADFVRQLGDEVGAKILNLSSTSYEPFGASAALLIGQELGNNELRDQASVPREQSQLAHLDASHIAAHTYFDASEHFGQFRMEIEISTCGVPTPNALISSVINHCAADFVQIDFRVRGISWSEEGLPMLAGKDLSEAAWDVPDYNVSVFTEQRSLYFELVRKTADSEILELIWQMQEAQG